MARVECIAEVGDCQPRPLETGARRRRPRRFLILELYSEHSSAVMYTASKVATLLYTMLSYLVDEPNICHLYI